MAIRITANTRFVSPLGPWSVSELERIYASARLAEGNVGDIPAKLFWPALLLTMLDTAEPPSVLLAVRRDDYDDAIGAVAIGPRVYHLHQLATAALRGLLPYLQSSPVLLPWPFDLKRKAWHTLVRRYKEILHRADLPYVTANLFPRLLLTAQVQSDILARLDLSSPFLPRGGKPSIPRARDRRPGASAAESAHYRSQKRAARNEPTHSDLVRISMNSNETLINFFKTSYAPLRMADAAARSVDDYRTTLEYFSRFFVCDATFANLTDDLIEHFLAWLKRCGLANPTINRRRVHLLALAKHAWRKRRIPEIPRDVQRYKEPKRLPDAWSIDEVAIILKTAAETPGRICGIAAGDYWPALLLLLYETGLRIAAAMKIRLSDLNQETGFLTIPADHQKQNAEQAFRLHADTIAAIARTNPSDRELLFPWPFDQDGSTRYLGKHLRKILKRAGLPHGRRDLFHKFRRTSGTAVAMALDEQAAKQHLGHSSLQVTKRYLDPRKLTRQHDTSERIQRPDWKVGQDNESAAAD